MGEGRVGVARKGGRDEGHPHDDRTKHLSDHYTASVQRTRQKHRSYLRLDIIEGE